jgi:hypothetical protein
MSTTPAFRRRAFLLGTIGAGVSLIARLPWSWPFLAPDRALTAERLVGLLTDGDKAVALGREYLRAVPEEADASVLTSVLVRSLSRQRGSLVRPSDGQLRESLRQASVDDFGVERTFELDGWILALTEARLCALAAACA